MAWDVLIVAPAQAHTLSIEDCLYLLYLKHQNNECDGLTNTPGPKELLASLPERRDYDHISFMLFYVIFFFIWIFWILVYSQKFTYAIMHPTMYAHEELIYTAKSAEHDQKEIGHRQGVAFEHSALDQVIPYICTGQDKH